MSVDDRGGIALVDKEPGWTSHDVVAKARGVLGTRKVGHSGTLDPAATGLLVLGVGRATRLLRFLTDMSKVYEAELTFGTETDSLDATGTVVARHDMSRLAPDDVVAGAAEFVGDIEQIPPMVSAVKVDGRRLHELARDGKVVERAPRPVTVMRFDVTPTEDPLRWTAVVECSSGTYVRTLAADLGTRLGGGAHLSALRRTHVGPFSVGEAATVDSATLLPIEEAARGRDRCEVDETLAAAVAVGKVLDPVELGIEGDPPWPIFGPGPRLLAYYEPYRDGLVKPSVVLTG